MAFWDKESPRDLGLRVLEAYYNDARGYGQFQFSTFGEFLAWAERATTLATDIGELIQNNSSTISEGEAVDAVRTLAHRSQGTASQGQIMQAAGSGYVSMNWTSAAPELAAEVGEGVLETGKEYAMAVGEGVGGTIKLVKYLPWIILGGSALYVFVIAKGHSKALGRK